MNQSDPRDDYAPHMNPADRFDDYGYEAVVTGTVDGFQILYPDITINLTSEGAREIVARILEISLGVETDE